MNVVKNAFGLCLALALPTYATDLIDMPDDSVNFYGKLNISIQSSGEGGHNLMS